MMTTDVELDWPSDPTQRDRLRYSIGRVCERHVELDLNLGMLHARLANLANASAEEAFRPTQSTARRINRCHNLLAESALPADMKRAGNGALGDARDANELRNRVVHDQWLERLEQVTEDSNSSQWTRVRIVHREPALIAEPSDQRYVDIAEHQLHRTCVRVNSLVRAIGRAEDLATARIEEGAGAPLPEGFGWREMLPDIRGEFDLQPDGSRRRCEPDEGD